MPSISRLFPEDMESPGVLKKENVEITGVNYERSGISRCVQGKTCGISMGFGFWP